MLIAALLIFWHACCMGCIARVMLKAALGSVFPPPDVSRQQPRRERIRAPRPDRAQAGRRGKT
eukprot:10174304-Alexandrium_andersonii.AAC.1